METEKKFTNSLAKEKSPYLLEHADNPVNWYAWNEEAFKIAENEGKMIFVSIGYSACHWCHVMRRESFENEQVAQILNQNFVSIKVDREERPDIDHLLQITFQIMNGRGGGWPLSIFMTPEKKPFYAGTYFPLQSKYGMPGFIDVLKAVNKAFKSKLQDINAQALQIENYIKNIQNPKTHLESDKFSSIHVVQYFAELFDKEYGGFGNAPKFPSETGLLLLLHESAFTNNSAGLNMVFTTLNAMSKGGIFDQLGGGFHRYSVDEKWLVPHFEKMLYNQSLLVLVLVEAYRLSHNKLYLEKIVETLDYVSREMQSPNGGFYSSQNADSEGIEGKYFIWDKKDLNFMDEDNLEIISDYFDITEHGNWEGKNILHIKTSIDQLSKKYGKTEEELLSIITNAKRSLLEIRENRIKPSTDTKILSSWNALMVKAYISASRIVMNSKEREKFLKIAKLGLQHLESMIDNDIIYRVFIENEKSIPGFLDDFQYTISAFLDYYEISLDENYLKIAIKLYNYTIEHFYDKEQGGFFYSLNEHQTIITKFKDTFDTPLPSPVAYGVQNAMRIDFFEPDSIQNTSEIIDKTLAGTRYGPEMDMMSIASMIYIKELAKNGFSEITIIKNHKHENLIGNQLLKLVNNIWIPFRLQIEADTSKLDSETKEKEFIKGKITEQDLLQVFICKNHVCSVPIIKNNKFIDYLVSIYPKISFKDIGY